MRKLRVILPEEAYTGVEFIQDQFLGIASINTSLVGFNSKEVFRWHLSILFDLQNTNAAKLPTDKEIKVLDKIEDEYHNLVIGPSKKKPNGLFLARIFWNNTAELIWRVYSPEEIHVKLSGILKDENYTHPFDYRIDDDKEWKLAEWHLDAVG
ncbi:DUF695 domain-containing protein [Neolewinella persica]|uniref:DUF695 domain-containing protein n=1 Tax=Neolewinella persica TaxID=70998 RepID=UPI00038195D1|nr:DUF695 domain-containing protein [Neolewinella persica]